MASGVCLTEYLNHLSPRLLLYCKTETEGLATTAVAASHRRYCKAEIAPQLSRPLIDVDRGQVSVQPPLIFYSRYSNSASSCADIVDPRQTPRVSKYDPLIIVVDTSDLQIVDNRTCKLRDTHVGSACTEVGGYDLFSRVIELSLKRKMLAFGPTIDEAD